MNVAKIALRIIEFLLAVFIGGLGLGVAVAMVDAYTHGRMRSNLGILLPVPVLLVYGSIRLLGFLATSDVRFRPEEFKVVEEVMAEEDELDP